MVRETFVEEGAWADRQAFGEQGQRRTIWEEGTKQVALEVQVRGGVGVTPGLGAALKAVSTDPAHTSMMGSSLPRRQALPAQSGSDGPRILVPSHILILADSSPFLSFPRSLG